MRFVPLCWGLLLFACRAQPGPQGPAPEYERPEVIPWDAGTPEDPLSAAESQGEWVDDEPDAGADAADSGPDSGAGGAANPPVLDASSEAEDHAVPPGSKPSVPSEPVKPK